MDWEKWIMRGLETLVVLLIVSFVLLIFSPVALNTTPGTGEKIGQVVKLSQEGIIGKTWEGQLIRGGMNGGSGSFGTVPFNFTVENNEEMVVKVQKYMRSQSEVIITYRMEGLYSGFRSSSGGHFLISIEPAKK